jgi:saccharopine dehydrogenase (NAD+, L-lysine forming)
MMKIGLVKEDKIPIDKRVALTPLQAKQIQLDFPKVKIVAQTSDIRCYTDQDYLQEGIEVVEDLRDCDILIGVKEVPIKNLIEGKTYLFFSHTIKKQSYNRKLLAAVLEKRIRLIDYEALTNDEGTRIVAFGRWAGIVGAYNAIWTFGKRFNLYHVRRAFECFDLEDLKSEYKKVLLPPIKIALTGGGRVSKGVMEVLLGMNIKKVTPHAFINEEFDFPVFCQLNIRDYHVRKEDLVFSRTEFYKDPTQFDGTFLKYARVADILIAGAFWDPKAPVLFKREDILADDFKIRIIADITCDIQGSIPSTLRSSTIEAPIYDFNPSENAIESALRDEANITVMAVDNLPCELPRDASDSFGNELVKNVLSHLLGEDLSEIIARATICEKGTLTKRFSYLQGFVDGRE